jgi:ATP-dependent DNA ligase
VHEIKFDGCRTQLHWRRPDAVLYTRNGFDWTGRYETLAAAAAKLTAKHAVLDGEVVALRADGSCDLAALQEDAKSRVGERLFDYAFYLLFLDGRDLRALRWPSARRGCASYWPLSRTAVSCSAIISISTARRSCATPSGSDAKASSPNAWPRRIGRVAAMIG